MPITINYVKPKGGKPRKLLPAQEAEVVRRFVDGFEAQKSIAASFGVSQPVIAGVLRRYRDAERLRRELVALRDVQVAQQQAAAESEAA